MTEPALCENGYVTCHSCGDTYQRIGYHWSNGSCGYPDIPIGKQQLIDGLMLGDGTLRTQSSSPCIQVYMTNKEFLSWLDSQLSWLTTGVSCDRTAEHSAELSGLRIDSDGTAENYSDVYVMQTRSMPQFDRYRSWYSIDGGRRYKAIPDDWEIDPISAKVWYACDGSLHWDHRYPDARPYSTLGTGRTSYGTVVDLFDGSTLDCVPSEETNRVRFTVDETERFLDWIGDPVPGFEYKWR